MKNLFTKAAYFAVTVLLMAGIMPVSGTAAPLAGVPNNKTHVAHHTSTLNNNFTYRSTGAYTGPAFVTPGPIVTTSGGNTAFVSGDNTASTPVAVDGAITVTDGGSATLASATVTISGNFASGQDLLAFTNDGLTMGNITAGVFDTGTGQLVLTSAGASATLAQWQAALQALTYTNTAVTPNTTARTISFMVDDGFGTSNTATKNIAVTATNQTPVVTATGGTTAHYVTGATALAVDGGITVSDLDNTTQTFGRATIIVGLNTGDVLAFTNTSSTLYGNITQASYVPASGQLTLQSSGSTATNAQWANALSAVTFSSTSTTAGNRTISFVVQSAGKMSTAVTDVVAVALPPTITLSPTTLPTVGRGAPYNQTVSATGGTAPYHYTVTAGTLPGGLSLAAATGVISGTSTASNGTYNFTITATDASTGSGAPFTGSQAYTVNVTPVVSSSPATPPAATVGTGYSGLTLSTVNGTGPYTYTVTGGTFPPGLILTGNSIVGTPTAGGTFTFTISSTDNSSAPGPFIATHDYTITVAPPTIIINPSPFPTPSPVVPFNQTLVSSGGTAPYTYAVTAGTLPAGISMASDGTFSGQATVLGAYSFSVTSTDSSTGTGPYTKTTIYSGTISGPIPTIAPATLVSGIKAGVPYSQTFTASGTNNTAPYTFSKGVSGALPPGLTIASDGTLSGTPTEVGSYLFQIRATDSSPSPGPYSTSKLYTGFTVIAPTIVVPSTVPNGTAGTAYSQPITATGGTAPYAYAVTAGALPAGLTLAPDGTLSGTSTVTGTFTFTVTATDATTNKTTPATVYSGSATVSITLIPPTITLATTLPAPTIGVSYNQNANASGGAAPHTYALTAGVLPPGLSLNAATGDITGTPTAGGNFNFTITATDANLFTGFQAYITTINPPTITFASGTLATGAVGVTYNQQVTASGGTAPFTYAVTGGTLPPGLTLGANGTLSGTPTTGGTYTFTITGTDSSTGTGSPFTGSQTYTITIGKIDQTIAFADITATYGDAPVSLTGTTTSGLGLTYTSSNPAVATVLGNTLTILGSGTATITASQAGNVNYNAAADVSKTLTVTKRTIAISAAAKTKVYGTADPALTYQVTSGSLVGTDAFTGALARNTGEAVNTYAIQQGTLTLGNNYTLAYTGANLTITPAALTATANNQTRVYGAANPAFTVSYTGFANGDDATKLTAAAVAVSAATTTSAPGNYPITVSGAASPNYTFNYINGTLTVTPLSNADLINLTASSGSLSPMFAGGTLNYNITVENAVSSLTFTPTYDVTASAMINGTAVPNGSPSYGVPLSVGNNAITLTVTAQDGITKKTYTLNVYRGLPPASIAATNILTPNGDGKNDYWIVKDIQLYPNNTVRVYDSAGRIVFAQKGYNNNWDGTLNDTGKPLAKGTYYYAIDLGVGGNVLKGYISIISSK